MPNEAKSQILVPLDPDPLRVREAIWRLEELPALSPAIQQALAMCGDPLCSSRDLERVLATDQSLVAQILKIANSAFYSLEAHTTTISRAVTVIGQEKLQTLLLQLMLAGALRHLRGQQPEARRIVAVSIAAAAACHALALCVPEQNEEELLVAGLLHNVGDLVLLAEFPSEYESARRLTASMPDRAAQRAIFGVDSRLAGRWLLEAWGLPMLFGESTHHWENPLQPKLDSCPRGFLCIVHVGAHLGRCWERQAAWQEVERLLSPQALEEILLSADTLSGVYESLSEHVGRVQTLME